MHEIEFYKTFILISTLELGEWTYPGFEGDQFKDHLHSEKSSKEHVEDVHGIIEIFGLSMMLQKHINI